MEDLSMCVFGFGENHYWIRCFLKQMVFYDTNHPQFTDDTAKQRVWMDIAMDYRSQFVKSLLNFGVTTVYFFVGFEQICLKEFFASKMKSMT